MRTLLKQIFMIVIFTLPLCNNHTTSPLSTAERYLMSATCIGVTYGLGRMGAWVRMWDTKRSFAQEMEHFSHFYGSQEEAKQMLQDIILIRHSSECTITHYRVYPLLWYKELLDNYMNRLRFWRMATIGTSDWKTIHTLIDQLQHLRNLVVTNYLYIGELRSFANDLQRYPYV